MSRLSPSLMLKLFEEPNKIIKTEWQRKEYDKRIANMVEEVKQRIKPSKEKQEALQLVDEIIGMT